MRHLVRESLKQSKPTGYQPADAALRPFNDWTNTRTASSIQSQIHQ